MCSGDIYFELLQAYHGDAIDYDEQSRLTWARIPHFYSMPFYVYQYATCFASSAQIMKQISERPGRGSCRGRRALSDAAQPGGSDHPMVLLQKAGVDLSRPETVRAVIDQLDVLVTRLEQEMSALV